jgi:hypothetical protein
MTILTALPVNMNDFKRLLVNVSPEHAVCVRGRHAVGKSEGVYQAAEEMRSDFYRDPQNCARLIEAFGGKVKVPKSKDNPNGWTAKWTYEMGVPVLERRLSQMTEGDIIGLPFRHGKDKFNHETGERISSASTSFKPCDWLINSCEFPVVLFLDERNRALDGVKQAVFQLTDSKAFYGNYLHEETRIVVAENEGDEYQVQQCDPAEISRCATISLQPSVQDWLNYAKDRCHDATVEYIRQNDRHLENSDGTEPNKKYPDRRSWFKLDQEAQRLKFFENPGDHLFYVLACSMVGTEVGGKFVRFVQEREREVTAEDILTSWKKAKKRLAGKATISNETYVECAAKIESFTSKNKLTVEQAGELAAFVKDAPAEVLMTVWTNISADTENMLIVHKYVEKLILKSALGEDVQNLTLPTVDEVKKVISDTKKKNGTATTEEVATTEEPKKKRGAKSK